MPTAPLRLSPLELARLAGIVLAALALRVLLPWRHVLIDGRVVVAGNDAWIHMRNADNVFAHWPWPTWFDPFRLAPEGQWTDAPLMDASVAGLAHLTGLSVDLAGAWFPAVAGALVPVPVYLLVRRVCGSIEATLAAVLVAALPGQLLARSLFGQADHHVLEALLAATILWLLARAIDSRTRRDLVLAGVALAAYLLTWSRGAFLVLALLAWAVPVALTAHGAGMTRLIGWTFGVALVLVAPVAIGFPPMALTVPLLAAGIALTAGADLMRERADTRGLAVAGVLLFGSLAIAAWVAGPTLVAQAVRFAPAGPASSVGEVRPLLWLGGPFSLAPLWTELTTAALLVWPGLWFLGRRTVQHREPAAMLLLVWSVLMIAAALAQARFSYYMAIAAAILAAIAARRLFWDGLPRALGFVAIGAIVVLPNLAPALTVAAAPSGGPDAAWRDALDWMRTHTPDPYDDPEAYLARYGSASDAPAARYGVMVWWDYAWWVSRVARRPPVTNPTQVAVKEAGRFYTATDEAGAVAVLRERHAAYVIVDRSMPMSVATAGRPQASQLELMVRWAERDPQAYYRVYRQRGQPVFVYSADYYRTMAIRLFAYGGRPYEPVDSTWAIRTEGDEIRDARRFRTHADGQAFVAQTPGWRIAGLHPLLSPVPVEGVPAFSREFASSQGVDGPIGRIPDVAVFRVTAPRPLGGEERMKKTESTKEGRNDE
ncbi:MAG: STT3 domain-containing protein [Vicinamibacterales bacterium]